MDKETLIDPIRKFCLNHIEPTALKDDEAAQFRPEIYRGLADLGVCATMMPEEFGGLELSSLHYAWTLEEVARTSLAYAVSLSVSGLVQTAILQTGSDEQKKYYLPSFGTGKMIGAFALTEPTSGSDAAALRTKAEKRGNTYVLNGQKQFITNGGIATVYLVMARTGDETGHGISAFLVPADAPGLEIGKKETKMGWRASPTTSLHFDGCVIPETARVGNEGDGFSIAKGTLDSGRINIAAMAIGLASRALDIALPYSLERKQFGSPIIEFQGVSFMLSDMYIGIEAGRALLEKATALKDEGESYSPIAAALKCFATDQAMKITTDAVQVLGGYGYMSEYTVERLMRDAKVLQIVEGTNQIQRHIISRHLRKEATA